MNGRDTHTAEGTQPLTVAVTSANSLTGRMMLPRLAERGVRAVALVRAPADLPVETITDWTTAPAAEEVLRGADVVVHLSGEIAARSAAAYDAANVATTAIVARALREGRARRVIFISFPGADPRSNNLFLRAKGQAEQLLAKSGAESVTFRVSAIVDRPEDPPGGFQQALLTPPGGKARMIGDGRRRLRPILRGDVVAALLAAIDDGAPGTHELGGPDELTADELIRLVNRRSDVSIAHTPAWLARILSRALPDLPPTMVELLLRDVTGGDPAPTAWEFGFRLTPLEAAFAPASAPTLQRSVT